MSVKDLTLLLEKKLKIDEFNSKVQRKAVIRYLCVIIDFSADSYNCQEMRPSRAAVIKDLLTKFIKEFNEQNPLSKLSFIITQNEDAELISDFSSSQEDHVSKLKRNNAGV
jgi:transcription initiation factor TFIIH subunit 2